MSGLPTTMVQGQTAHTQNGLPIMTVTGMGALAPPTMAVINQMQAQIKALQSKATAADAELKSLSLRIAKLGG